MAVKIPLKKSWELLIPEAAKIGKELFILCIVFLPALQFIHFAQVTQSILLNC